MSGAPAYIGDLEKKILSPLTDPVEHTIDIALILGVVVVLFIVWLTFRHPKAAGDIAKGFL